MTSRWPFCYIYSLFTHHLLSRYSPMIKLLMIRPNLRNLQGRSGADGGPIRPPGESDPPMPAHSLYNQPASQSANQPNLWPNLSDQSNQYHVGCGGSGDGKKSISPPEVEAYCH